VCQSYFEHLFILSSDTRYDGLLKRLKNHPLGVVALCITGTVMALATFTTSLQTLWHVFSPVETKHGEQINTSTATSVQAPPKRPVPEHPSENPLCRYVLFTRTHFEETKAVYLFDGTRGGRDETDMHRPFVLALKNYDPGDYALDISFKTLVADIGPKDAGNWHIPVHLDEHPYYIVRQDNPDFSTSPRFESLSDNELTRFRAQNKIDIPSCSEISAGTTWHE
jgi:hypothetical protein